MGLIVNVEKTKYIVETRGPEDSSNLKVVDKIMNLKNLKN
jgi:hypothetical protein